MVTASQTDVSKDRSRVSKDLPLGSDCSLTNERVSVEEETTRALVPLLPRALHFALSSPLRCGNIMGLS